MGGQHVPERVRVSFYVCLTDSIVPVGDAQWDRSPVWRAAIEGHEDIVRMLIEAKADPNAADIARMLIKSKADPNVAKKVGVLVCIHTRRS